MKSNPDQRDPDWPKYPETILRFTVDPIVSVDLRAVVTSATLTELDRIGLLEPFAIMTAFDPRGQNLTREENDRLSGRLDERLREVGHEFIRVDACSPDGAHCERSVAVKMAKEEAVTLAAEFEQVALFWFDGGQFWILAVLDEADPIMLPRIS